MVITHYRMVFAILDMVDAGAMTTTALTAGEKRFGNLVAVLGYALTVAIGQILLMTRGVVIVRVLI
jgi:hypothetical protein